MAPQADTPVYRENLTEGKTHGQQNLLIELHVRLRAMDGGSSTLENIHDLSRMMDLCFNSPQLRHNLKFGRFESAVLTLVEEGMQKTIHSLQRQLLQPWCNLHGIDAYELRHRVPDITVYSDDYRDMFACSTDIQQFEDVDLRSADFEVVRQLLKALGRHAGRLNIALSGENGRSLGVNVNKWFFDYAVWLMMRISVTMSVLLFRGWEVRSLNQTVPGTGVAALDERFVVASKIQVNEFGRLEGLGKKIDALEKRGMAKIKALRQRFGDRP